MHPSRFILIVLSVILLFAMACDDETRITPTQPASPVAPDPVMATTSGPGGETRTPFQQSIEDGIALRASQGLPVPANVTYEYTAPSGAPLSTILQQGVTPGEAVTVVAKTTIEFENPVQAGYLEWPDLVVENNMPPGSYDRGYIHEGNYTQFAKDELEKQYPGIWNTEDFKQQARRYTFTETITINCPDFTAEVQGSEPTAQSTSTYLDELLMGFTILGPALDYHIDWHVDVWFFGWHDLLDFWAGFKLDWTIGMRLPMQTNLSSDEPLLEGSTYFPTSSIQGIDWDAQDYSDAGVSSEEGNEYILYFIFKFGLFIDVFGESVVDLGVDVEKDDRSSFATPFGPGSYFALSTLNIPLWEFNMGIANGGIGFGLTPMLGSSQFTADWNVSGDATGSGSLTYNNSMSPVTLGAVTAIDGPGQANVLMDNFKYYFNQFLLDLSLYFELHVIIFGDGYWSIPITDFDLSVLTGSLHTGTHSGTPSSTMNMLTVQNVAPTAVIDRSGTIMLGGTPTFLIEAGDMVHFSGRSIDPGQDDLTLSWDFGDGPPSPDATTMYPIPYDVTESKYHTFDEACVYMVTFTSVDDDGGMSQDQVPVIVTSEYGSRARMEGYWQHQLKGNGHVDFDTTTLECYLNMIGLMSTVFNEVRDASTVESAFDVLFLKTNEGMELEQLDRDLLVVWLNFANGVFEYNGLLDIDDDGMPDGTFSQLVAAAETVRLNPMATKAEIKEQTRIMHHLSALQTGEGVISSPDQLLLESGRR